MTIEEIKADTRPAISMLDAATALGCQPQALRIIARDNPASLGFPTIRVGKKKTIVPRMAFLKFLGEADDHE